MKTINDENKSKITNFSLLFPFENEKINMKIDY